MNKEKVKVYIYTRVSTSMQIDGYSLDAQKSRMKAFCDFNDYEIAGEYEDAGKSGKTIEGRIALNQMMEDFGVNLICVEDGIDSSKDAGKLMISVLSAVAEIERENIRIQTMEGRMQKAREGKWNGGFAPYGYKLMDGKLEINEEMLDNAVAEVIRTLVSNKKFAGMMKQKINMEVDTSALDQEIANYEKQLRQCFANRDSIMADLDSIDYEDKHYRRRKADLEERLYKTYDKIEEMEVSLVAAKAKRRSILSDKVSSDNIYKALVFFDRMYDKMNEAEKREFLEQLISKVEIFEERQANGQWLKSIEFKLPIIEHDMKLSLDNGDTVECVIMMQYNANKFA